MLFFYILPPGRNVNVSIRICIVRSLKMHVRMLLIFRRSVGMKKRYFSNGEIALWSGSVFAIVAAFILFDRSSYMTLSASLIGVTSLIFSAKGNPLG